MKHYLTIFVLLCTISTVHGAQFVYHAGGFRANYYVYARNDPLSDGPWILTTPGSTIAVSVSRTAAVFQAYGYAYNNIWSKTSTNSIRIQSFSKAEGAADTGSSYAQGKGFGRTENALTKGIFYKIMPDVNEQVGDDVMVYYNHTANISTNNGTTAFQIGGPGTMNHIAITRGQLPPVTTEPVRENEVLSFPDVNVTNSASTDWFSGIHAFPALIGDVIGIFAENSTAVIGWGTMSGSIESMFSMVLSVEPVLLGDLDFDDDVDFYDLAILANNWLVDIGFDPAQDTTPPDPDPMDWAEGGKPREIFECECPPFCGYYCATMTAKTATDPSGGVQYEFQCSESDFSSSWQGSPTYSVTIGGSGFNYTFKVRARDIHDNRTDWSDAWPMNP